MNYNKYPILEYDNDICRIIDPEKNHPKLANMTEYCVLCFFQDAIKNYIENNPVEILTELKSELCNFPIYITIFNNKKIAFLNPGVGSPLVAAILEEVISLGARKIIVCGGAGVLDKNIITGKLIIPNTAVRDEGTSYHYCEPNREIEASKIMISKIINVLNKYKIEYIKGKTWTTDGIYRETKSKIELRKKEGCITVEMEASALFAVAKYRKIELAQILYAGDDVSGDNWDKREWDSRANIRKNLFEISLEACLEND